MTTTNTKTLLSVAIRARGGTCAVNGTHLDGGATGQQPHISTAQEIDASRYVALYICDKCGCVFTPKEATP